VNHHSRRLVDNDNIIVLVNHVERNVFSHRLGFPHFGQGDFYLVACLYGIFFRLGLSRNVYTALVNKAEKKGRTRAEVDEITCRLTGYFDLNELEGKSYGEFIAGAPAWNARAELITGKICGVQVETIEDPMMKKVRQLDKLVDELAKGKTMEKIKR
jgi:hypothetical protein